MLGALCTVEPTFSKHQHARYENWKSILLIFSLFIRRANGGPTQNIKMKKSNYFVQHRANVGPKLIFANEKKLINIGPVFGYRQID